MPHIIFLLLIASSPFFIKGDETASWGSIQPGPSESECRPYIEKALQQGASTQDSINEPGDADDVGESDHQEEEATITEVSEDVPPDLSTPNDETEDKSGETDTQSVTDRDQQEVKPEQSIEEDTFQAEVESQEASDNVTTKQNIESGESHEIASDHEEEKESKEVASGESNEDNSLENVSNAQNNAELKSSAESEIEAEASYETEIEEHTESVEEEVENRKETETSEELETKTANESETEGDSQDANSIDASKEKEDTESKEISEDSEKENATMEEIDDKILSEAKIEASTGESGEAAEVSSISEEQQTEGAATAEPSFENVVKTDQSDEINSSEKESLEVKDDSSSEKGAEVLEKETDTQNLVPHNNSEETHDDELAASKSEVGINDEASFEQANVDSNEIPEKFEEVDASHDSHKEEESGVEKGEEVLDSIEEVNKDNATHTGKEKTEEATPEEELSMIMDIPENLRSREHMVQILRLSSENEEMEKGLGKIAESTLRELKKLYDAAIKPLEILYKYRDLSNRHFGDPEIFSKPLILFMGPWSGGKSTIINYLLENEYKRTALRTGAEPSPAYFNIVMKGDVEEVLDGTQLAADWTFSGLQKFGQGLLDRLRGLKLNHPLLEKVNIVEIPGILEIRKQVERLFPFNDACQWFIDRADIIFLVYDPSKLDVGPETEAILDQLKGREMQTKIILNKADQVKPEELMRVQGTLIWNISPLMSSTEPPIMYSTSLWSNPYESGAPTRLLFAQERAFLKDLRDAVDKRVENKIASARRFAVRVRNHAKMVDCYLTTYYNHKSFFGNKKKVSDDIIEHPQNYHIYEGLSTLTNISRYDLPDPDVYRDFFRLNPVYEFQQLASTCTYFRGCPINRLDVAIAYDLPELVGKYKKQVEELLNYSKK